MPQTGLPQAWAGQGMGEGFYTPGASRGDDQRHLQMRSVGHGRAIQCNKKPQVANVRDIRTWTFTNYVTVVKSRMAVSESCETSESGHARTTVRVAKCKMKVSESYETSESGPSRTPVRVDNSKTHIDVS